MNTNTNTRYKQEENENHNKNDTNTQQQNKHNNNQLSTQSKHLVSCLHQIHTHTLTHIKNSKKTKNKKTTRDI